MTIELDTPRSAPSAPTRAATPPPQRRTGRWIDHWDPEDPAFWESRGRRVARRNLAWSIFAEHLGFSVWLLWSVTATFLASAGFAFTPQQLFWLVAAPNLVGALIRLPYTFAVPRFGARNWTGVSALLLLVPTGLFAWFVQRPDTPYWVFIVIAATAGVGGGNFASSMASINFFYPASRKGAALGLNAAGGNLGVSLVQLFLPVVVGGAGLFGLVQASGSGIALERAAYVWGGLAVLAAAGAFFFMNNLSVAASRPREQLRVVTYRHTWIMALLYIGTFGSFIGFSAAMPLLIKINFWNQPVPDVVGIGVNVASFAFLGALVGSITRPFGGWLADRFGGARITVVSFALMTVGTLAVLLTLTRLTPVPKIDPTTVDPETFTYPTAVTSAVEANEQVFWFFLAAFLFVFAASGVGNGSTYRMIPIIWKVQAEQAGPEGSSERRDALLRSTREASAVLGIVGAIGAIGGFLIPMTFGAPWITDPVSAVKTAFALFAAFYVVCLVVTWAVYLRPRSAMARAKV
ncbi:MULTISPECIES: MFS transporter [unclassified Aeromicrobium]|uniref:MFS transporter n=1 Tax=unclassified Aeromicrobium TaxID=2633570 RepID=UPI00288BDD3D|nr:MULTISPECIES: MFS transporter [unclassified Aeromicrobium]